MPAILRIFKSRLLLYLGICVLALSALLSSPARRAFVVHTLRAPLASTSRMTSTYVKELRVAELAVQRASLLTNKVFQDKVRQAVTKDDKSPVTVADFGAQALIIHAIKSNFPDDLVIGEEEASVLRHDETLRSQVWDLVQNATLEDPDASKTVGGPLVDIAQMLDLIDLGNSPGGEKGRFWVLDPVDGTKGFLRGGQYAVCLGLVVDGDVKVGVLGCPNLPLDNQIPLFSADGTPNIAADGNGILLAASKAHGATIRPLGQGALEPSKPIEVRSTTNVKDATFCEGVEAAHSSHEDQSAIAKKLGITRPSLRMDSQAKYASVARGAADIYLRLPVRKDYQENTWDHAAGDLIVREAGGLVTDADGKRLDFGKGRKLINNRGIVVAPPGVFPLVLDAVKAVLNDS